MLKICEYKKEYRRRLHAGLAFAQCEGKKENHLYSKIWLRYYWLVLMMLCLQNMIPASCNERFSGCTVVFQQYIYIYVCVCVCVCLCVWERERVCVCVSRNIVTRKIRNICGVIDVFTVFLTSFAARISLKEKFWWKNIFNIFFKS